MRNNSIVKECRLYLGLPTTKTPFKDIILGSLTSLIAIISVIYFSQLCLNYINVTEQVSYNTYVLISIAATSVLVFAIPHGALSQPWQVLAGNVVSALLGVLSWKYLGSNVIVAAAFAVALAILAMSYLRCIHPPGGATALGAVLGGDAIHELGFNYILVPTLLNSVIIILAGIILNYPFRWRRYPSHSYFKTHSEGKISPGDRENEITIEDFMKSISEHGSYIDITDEAWVEIFENAKRHAELDIEHPTEIAAGFAYSNGKIGNKWEIRQISAINKQSVKFTVLAGINSGSFGQCTVNEFVSWAKFEVDQNTFGVWARTSEYT
ncbi:HPP family protein [Pseudocolwellia agarivorans]|uniref:HPP family protein n=1 Tax=Pseudocolwellia agarivorans TaxID=1911682 RepID=UPI0009856064|nr:HPP family protein [Pseudocolwellia agarivorans]